MKIVEVKTVVLCVAVLCMAGCARELPAEPENGEAELEVSFETGTKAFPSGKEGAINSVQMLLFRMDGASELYRYYRFDDNEVLGKKSVVNGIAPGKYRCHIIANGPSFADVRNLDDLQKTRLELPEVNDTAKGFLMSYRNDALEIKEGYNSLDAVMPRFAGRAMLSKIINNIPKSLGEVKVERAFLTNVLGTVCYDGAATNPSWFNRQGRMDENPQVKEHIINGAGCPASCPGITFCEINRTLSNGDTLNLFFPFYAYGNDRQVRLNGFEEGTFNEQATALVVVASTGGKTYYYPIALTGESRMMPNTAVDVKLRILGYGSDDPQRQVPSSAVSSAVYSVGREHGARVEETL